MIYRLLIIIFLCPLTAMGDEKPWFPGCPSTIKNSYECAQHLENKSLIKYSALASRNGNTLTIIIASGNPASFVDINVENIQLKKYSLVDVYKDIGYALVHVQYWESHTYYLINLQTGQIENIEGMPVISPSRNYLVSTNLAGLSGESDPIIKIYKLSKPHLILDWSLKPNWEPSDPKWISDTELSLAKNVFSEKLLKSKNANDPYIKENVSIAYSKGQWRLLDKPDHQN